MDLDLDVPPPVDEMSHKFIILSNYPVPSRRSSPQSFSSSIPTALLDPVSSGKTDFFPPVLLSWCFLSLVFLHASIQFQRRRPHTAHSTQHAKVEKHLGLRQ